MTTRGVTSAFAGFRFPREVIAVAVRWYLRYGLSYRDVEELAVMSPSMTISSPNEDITVSRSAVCCRDNRHEPQRSLRPGLVIGIVRISGGGWDVIFNRAETSLPGSPR